MTAKTATRRIVILGGGTGGTLTANRLHRHYKHRDVEITVVDQDDHHIYQPGLLFVPFGLAHHNEIVRPRKAQLHKDIKFVLQAIDRVDLDRDTVVLEDGRELPYDVLVIATGVGLRSTRPRASPAPAGTSGSSRSTTSPAPRRWSTALADFEGGKLVVNVVDMPIKCPVAPLEFCFLADWYFTDRGIRDKVEITYATPLDGAFTKPVASAALTSLLEEKGIHMITEFNTGEVVGAPDEASGESAKLVGYDGREIPFDMAVVIPLHSGAAYVGRSEGLGDDLNFVPTDKRTLQTTAKAERVRPRRRHQPAHVQGRLGHPLRGRGARRQHHPLHRRPRELDASTTATPTASSRPASARPCSSTSTTRPSH